MTSRSPTLSDARIEAILDLLMQLAAGNLTVSLPHTGRGDVIDAIIESINMLAEELRASRTELEEAHERLLRREKLAVMGQLCGGVAHELRNPLGAVKNAAFYLRMVLERPEPEVQEIIGIIEKEVHTCERIIGGLLDFARPRLAGQVKLDLNELLETVIARLAVPSNVELVRQLAADLPQVVADPTKLEQAFGNLVLNAIQSIAEETEERRGRVTVTSEAREQGWIAVSVTDTGPGITAENMQRIFEPLFTTKAKGIGLGLAVTRTAIELHGGQIEVHSEPGRGTTMRVCLPTRPAERGAEAAAGDGASAGGGPAADGGG